MNSDASLFLSYVFETRELYIWCHCDDQSGHGGRGKEEDGRGGLENTWLLMEAITPRPMAWPYPPKFKDFWWFFDACKPWKSRFWGSVIITIFFTVKFREKWSNREVCSCSVAQFQAFSTFFLILGGCTPPRLKRTFLSQGGVYPPLIKSQITSRF